MIMPYIFEARTLSLNNLNQNLKYRLYFSSLLLSAFWLPFLRSVGITEIYITTRIFMLHTMSSLIQEGNKEEVRTF